MTGTWRPGNNGAGKMRWFVLRERPEPEQGRFGRYEYGNRSDGSLRRFASPEAANRFAAKLNAATISVPHRLLDGP